VASPVSRDVAIAKLTHAHGGCFSFLFSLFSFLFSLFSFLFSLFSFLFSLFSFLGTLRDAMRKGALAARGKPPGQAKPGVGGDAAWQLCVGTNRTYPPCDKPSDAYQQSSGTDCSGATKISSYLSAMV
jgi:hypothetical protein